MAVEHVSEGTKHVLDGVSIITVVGTLADVLPAVAALFTIVWTCIRIFETRTVRQWMGKEPYDK